MKLLLLIISLLAFMSFRNDVENTSDNNPHFMHDTVVDFESEVVGKTPSGFSQQNNNCDQSVNWVMQEQGDNKFVTQKNKNTGDCINLITSIMTCKNLTLTAHVKAVGGEKVQGGGLVWRFIDNANYYRAGFNPLEKTFSLYKVVKGKTTEIQKATCDFGISLWATMSIEANNSHILCWFNGEKLIDLNDKSLKKEGKIGFWTKADAETWFDELFILPKKKTYYY
jgi:hypothetical protein